MARGAILWSVAALFACVIIFLGFHILKVFLKPSEPVKEKYIEYKPSDIPKPMPPPEKQTTLPPRNEFNDDSNEEMPAEEQFQKTERTQMPAVAGQNEEDLRASEPHIASPPSTFYDTPEATDPLNKISHMDAEFGSNLRHPEQMIERRSQRNTNQIIPSGLGSDVSGPGAHSMAGYSPEMMSNGGEFMKGIIAFDSSEMGSGFSMV